MLGIRPKPDFPLGLTTAPPIQVNQLVRKLLMHGEEEEEEEELWKKKKEIRKTKTTIKKDEEEEEIRRTTKQESKSDWLSRESNGERTLAEHSPNDH